MSLSVYIKEMEEELKSILSYWMKYTIDRDNGGFFGKIDADDKVFPGAPKGLVLNSRILWAFSAAYNHTKDPQYLAPAKRAYEYLLARFIDREYGGAWWSVDHAGMPLDQRKQIYGLAFCLYGLSEYYQAEKKQQALDEAIELFRLIEKYSYDTERMGYYEAFTRDWKQIEDLRLSQKDANEKKTMNTHLHVLEAYANLYKSWPDPELKRQIGRLLEVFARYIVDARTGHLHLFFDEDWTVRSNIISYGHDIEAAWLLQESAEVTGEKEWTGAMKGLALKIATAAAEGLDADGGLWYEYEGGGAHFNGAQGGVSVGDGASPMAKTGHLIREKHSWPQAEAMIGFLNAWQLSGHDHWLEQSLASWQFVKNHIKDQANGEWFWGVTEDYSPMPGQDKAGFWKCPYHNSRACLEIIKRISSIKNE